MTHQLKLIKTLGFLPKEGAGDIYYKSYPDCDNYHIEIDFNKEKINYGRLITSVSKTTANFSQAENWVVLECVNRLLEKSYQPKNIILEKTYPAGHGHSGRLDICVNDDNGQEYLLIECKTYAAEFDKELSKIKKQVGQLFTYFKFENKANIIMLYASKLATGEVVYRNEIIKIEDNHRTGSKKDFYDSWNKIIKDNGVFDNWATPYNFISKALTLNDLIAITEQDSSNIFNRFLEILRHNVVSDKGNAFNKIFTLFLCKVYDEKSTKLNAELKFQWLKSDDDISFQIRLTDLYKKGMLEFLDKEVSDFSTDEFDKKYKNLDDSIKQNLRKDFFKLRLEKNNEFAIKEVFDNQSFKENAKIVKEVVELLQKYKLRYNKRQQYLSDFFEMLLTTGLKQESGQFFTPVPIAQFIIKSMPFDKLVNEKLDQGKQDNLMPLVMDYAAGSGHFLTESMHEMQRILDTKNPDDYIKTTGDNIYNWQRNHFNWAETYVYGIEKDYRLVKVGKVGCYLHGDGLANVILSDGLANFKTKEYKGLLTKTDDNFPQENKQFDVVISNPPYSVSSFKNTTTDYYNQDDFELYSKLTDTSSEIECLFVERTKQLLKDGGIAGIILPSSILSNAGIYSKTRAIIFKYFEIIAITELGSNTFMATDINTVVLFLKRRDNYQHQNIQKSVVKFFDNLQDLTINAVKSPVSKYIQNAWQGIDFDDYKTLLQKTPNNLIQKHELFKEYQLKIKAKDDNHKLANILEIEQQKLFYFILAYPQKIVLVKTGDKKAEKQFLGYRFSNRRGNEGIHPMQRGKGIDECTQLFDSNVFDNPQKASTYIYKAFNNELGFEIDEALKNNVSSVDLVDLMSFDRVGFEKTISLSIKKKLKIESQWDSVELGKNIKFKLKSKKAASLGMEVGNYPFYTSSQILNKFIDNYDYEDENIIIGDGGNSSIFINKQFSVSDHNFVFSSNNPELLNKYIYNFYKINFCLIQYGLKGQGLKNISKQYLKELKIPVPPKDIQQKIIDEIEVLEQRENQTNSKMAKHKDAIFKLLNKNTQQGKISNICQIVKEKINPKDFANEQFCYLGLEHIESNSGKILVKNIENSNNIHSIKNSFKQGQVLYGKLRPYLNKVALTKYSGICSTDILVLDSEYPLILKYILLSDNLAKQVLGLMSGVSLPRIKQDMFLNLSIPIPIEQKKIVKQIEKIEAEIIKLESKISNIPKQKEQVLKKYL